MKKIVSLDHLRDVCRTGEPKEFRLLLNAGVFSRKIIEYSSDGSELYPWCVFHYIDESEGHYNDAELERDTNIVKGIEKGALWMEEG